MNYCRNTKNKRVLSKKRVSITFVMIVILALYICYYPDCVMAKSEIEQLFVADGDPNDWYGFCIDISGDVAVVSAPRSDDAGKDSGSVYVYRFNGVSWIEEAKLQPSDAGTLHWFGWSVAIDGNVIIVGSTQTQDAGEWTGSAYIFRFNGTNWIEESRLLADGVGHWWEEFGYDVAIDGNRVLIGAPKANYNGSKSGAAYIFKFDGSDWIQEAKLLASDGVELGQFGGSVAILGKTAVMGAPGNDTTGHTAGSMYIFQFDGSNWYETEKLRASDATHGDHLGHSLSISGNKILVTSYGDDNARPGDVFCNSGSAYVFRFDSSSLSWKEEAKLQIPEAVCGDLWGWSGEISGNTVVIGAPGGGWGYGIGPGYATVFRYDGTNWVRGESLLASDGEYGDHFGWSVGLDSNTAIVGADFDCHNESCSGSAYVFDVRLYRGDLNMDGKVDFADFAIFSETWLDGL